MLMNGEKYYFDRNKNIKRDFKIYVKTVKEERERKGKEKFVKRKDPHR